jgi:hypothetical protein
MSLNKEGGQEFGGWNGDNNAGGSAAPQAPADGGILGALFRMNSMVSDNRNLKIVAEVYEVLNDQIYKNIQTSTTDAQQRQIVPKIEHLTSNISSQLPGLGMYAVIDQTMYVMGALFSNRDNSIGTEHITINTGVGQQQRVSIPITPAAQINKGFADRLKEHYQRAAAVQNVSNVEIINLIVVDMEMLNHPESGDQKDWPHSIAMYLARQWEKALLVYGAEKIVERGYAIPSPWLEPNTPYGKDNCAEARVVAIPGRVTDGKTLSPANMEVIVTTMNANGNNQNYSPTTTREIARATATVSLTGVTYEEYQQQMLLQSQSGDYMSNLKAFMGNSFNMGSIWPGTYRPLRPEITIDQVTAGEMMHNNGGLYPFFFGLYALMTTNNQFVFADALRKTHVGGRGSLAGLETRIQMMVQNMPGAQNALNPALRPPLNDKNINDTDFVTNWIQQNVSAHAVFKINLISNGPDAPIINFMRKLMAQDNTAAVKVVVALIDSMSKNKFSAIIADNAEHKRGWVPGKPILIGTNTIVVNGLATTPGGKDDKERYINTQEVDEMFICNAKPGNSVASKAAIENYMGIVYGNGQNEDFKQRSQKLRIEQSSSLFDGRNHINGFGNAAIFAPDFMAAMAQAMDGIGQLNVANNLGSFRTNRLAFAPGIGLATTAGAGSNGSLINQGQLFNVFNPLF